MIATGGFGTFPQNSLTQTFQEVISENISADFLNPFNAYMENISAPTIQPQPDSSSEPAFDLIGTLAGPVNSPVAANSTLSLEQINTSIAEFSASMTAEATGTLIQTETPISTLTTAPTITLIPTASETATIIIYPTNTKKPPPPDTPTSTPTNTPTSTPTPIPAGYTLNTITLNSYPDYAIYVAPGSTFNVSYGYQVWSAGNCPTCVEQLVTGMGSAGVGTNTCGYNGIPGVSPGVTGAANQTLTAPGAAGIYDIIVELNAQFTCAAAVTNYTGSLSSSLISKQLGQIAVSGNANVINVYYSAAVAGNLGGRAGADAICLAAKPPQFVNPKVHALISISSTDSIATMRSLYNISTSLPIVYGNSRLMAKNWADLVDGSANASLVAGGFSSNFWWSGTENDLGNAISATSNCVGFTSNMSSDYGNVGNATTNGSGWMNVTGSPQTCAQTYPLVCIAAP